MAPIAVTTDPLDPPVAVLELTGEHDGFTALRIEQELQRLHDAGLAVVVDLLRATFVDSSTLSALLTARRHAEESSLGFALAIAADAGLQVHRIFATTGLESAFVVAPTREGAVAAVRQRIAAPASDDAFRPVK